MKPNNFSFVIPQLLAGMGYPGIFQPLERDLAFLKSQKIAAIVSLTEHSLNSRLINQLGFDYLHLPVPDFTPPTLAQVENFVHFVDCFIPDKKGVVVHCQAGMGRTGTMLASYFIKLGYAPKESIHQIRSLRNGSIETPEQEKLIFEYADHLAASKSKGNADNS